MAERYILGEFTVKILMKKNAPLIRIRRTKKMSQTETSPLTQNVPTDSQEIRSSANIYALWERWKQEFPWLFWTNP